LIRTSMIGKEEAGFPPSGSPLRRATAGPKKTILKAKIWF